jgi:hypothetical protein
MTREDVPPMQYMRHLLATLAYRATKTVRHTPDSFGDYRPGTGSRSTLEIITHMGDLLDWALSLAQGKGVWRDSHPQPWALEIARFYASLNALDVYLAGTPVLACSPEKLLQGPIADAISHVGQLAMMRRLSGIPVKGENYFKADIRSGRVGPEQAAPRREFD